MHRGERISQAYADPGGRDARGTSGIANAAHRFADRAKPRAITIGARLAITRDAYQGELGIQGVQNVPAQAESFEGAWAQVFDQDISALDQLLDDVDTLSRFQVEGKRLFVAGLEVPPQRGALVHLSPFAKRVTITHRLDLDHLGAELAQQASGKWRSNQGTNFNDPEAA
ncbi:hypothetical protein D3C79_779030 [compost metagenome]